MPGESEPFLTFRADYKTSRDEIGKGRGNSCSQQAKSPSLKPLLAIQPPFFHSFLFLTGLTRFEDYPCPPGYWCPGKGDAFLCPAGTSRIQPGAKSLEECDPCSPGYYCPDPAQTGLPNTQGVPCKPGYECPAGDMSVLLCFLYFQPFLSLDG